MLKLIILSRAANYLKKIKEKPLELEFQKIIDDIIQTLTSVTLKLVVWQVFTVVTFFTIKQITSLHTLPC